MTHITDGIKPTFRRHYEFADGHQQNGGVGIGPIAKPYTDGVYIGEGVVTMRSVELVIDGSVRRYLWEEIIDGGVRRYSENLLPNIHTILSSDVRVCPAVRASGESEIEGGGGCFSEGEIERGRGKGCSVLIWGKIPEPYYSDLPTDPTVGV